MFLLKQFPLFHVFYTNIYMVYILNCVKLYFVYITVQYGGTSFFPFGTVSYSIRSLCVGNVKSILGQQTVSIVSSNSFGEINVLGMVEVLTYGRRYGLYGAGAGERVCLRPRVPVFRREDEHRPRVPSSAGALGNPWEFALSSDRHR